MELGQKLRQARLDAGLSQRQLCGDRLTRNMLSQIENGTARPSMETLRFLAQGLGKSVSFFLEEQAVCSPNQGIMEQARVAFAAEKYGTVLELLVDYRHPDPVFDQEQGLLRVLAGLKVAEQAIEKGRLPYGAQLLEQVADAGARTRYYLPELEQRRLILLARAAPERAGELASALASCDDALLLRARAALERDDGVRCGQYLDAAENSTSPDWNFLRGKACMVQGQYDRAMTYLRLAEQHYPAECAAELEQCCLAQEDYKGAYLYACKQRELGK